MRVLAAPNWRPNRSWLWAGVYIALALGVIALGLQVGSQIHTRSLPSGGVTLSIPYDRYLVGEPISFTIENAYNADIYIPNNCPQEPLAVYRYENGAWQRVHALAESSSCTTQNRRVKVPPKTSVTTSFAPWKDLFSQPGRYRIVARVDYYQTYPYQDIEVVPRPVAAAGEAAAVTTPRSTPSSSYPAISSGSRSVSLPRPTTPTPLPAANPTPSPQLPAQSVHVTGGTVHVTYSPTMIYVQSVTPDLGYTYEGGRSGSTVQVTFKRNGSEIQLTLYLRNGQLQQRVETD